MAHQLTEDQETLLASTIKRARVRARSAWKASGTFNQPSVDEAFDKGFEAAMDFAFSDEFERFIDRLRSMLEVGAPSLH